MNTVKELRYKRTLFVGLGGAGAKTLRKLKRKIKSANGGKLPSQVKFLLIDTNATELSNFRDFDSCEKVCIAVREPYQRYLHDKKEETHKFIPSKNAHSLLALERGAGQIRSNGHFAVIENQYSNKLLRVFREAGDSLMDIDIDGDKLERDPKIEVRLVFSIAGGTGSGTFLPISMIIRKAIKHSELTAYIYSATNFSKRVENSAKYSVMQNAYAALCELDYMMHFGSNDKRYENIKFNFGPNIQTQQIEQSNRPFEEVYYVDKYTSLPTADTVEFSYNELNRLQDNTAETMHIAATNIITAHTSSVDNVRQKILEGQFNLGDKFAWISGLGIAELFFREMDSTNPNVINACKMAIDARLDSTPLLDPISAEQTATRFMAYKYDESEGPKDKDPILNEFLKESRIAEICVQHVEDKKDGTLKSSKLGLNLERIMLDEIGSTPNDKVKEKVAAFESELEKLIINIIDKDRDSENQQINVVVDKDGKKTGLIISLPNLEIILEKIHNKIVSSISKIKSEQEAHATERDKYDNLITTEKPEDPGSKKKWSLGFLKWETKAEKGNDTEYHNTLEDLLHEYQENALKNYILVERDQKTLDVLEQCEEIIKIKIAEINNWMRVLELAQNVIPSLKSTSSSVFSSSHVKENRVEVQMIDVAKDFRLNYKELTFTAGGNRSGELNTPESIYIAISDFLTKEYGDLKQYLVKGKAEIDSLVEDKQVRVGRTECQKKIERLIDLSTPTMQVDSHGYGEKVNPDHFWYIMTDCPEENMAEKIQTQEKQTDKDKSIGALLKELVEQNTLDAKVNLVHVPGWEHKAVVYRVVSAVPPYFVDGVCISTAGGYTLEGCYEELKKTKRTYTPFSHETLRKKLENRNCVLKPNDDVAESEAMEHWLNFNLLDFIHFESIKGTYGQYSVYSKTLGEVLTDKLVDKNHILLLGTTRMEAFETFSRYCKALVNEYSEEDDNPNNRSYVDLTDPLDYDNTDDYCRKFIMDGREYLNTIFTKHTFLWHDKRILWEDFNKHLTKDSIDYKILSKEMDAMDARKKKYQKEQTERNNAENTSKGYDKP